MRTKEEPSFADVLETLRRVSWREQLPSVDWEKGGQETPTCSTYRKLGLTPDDGKATPLLTTDNVGSGAKHFLNTFPYLGPPQ